MRGHAVARAKSPARARDPVESGGLWHQPALMHLLADVLLVFALTVLAWGALTVLQRLPLFPLRELFVMHVPERVALPSIEHVARTGVAGNFFTVNLESPRVAFEKLPWVRQASLQRVWPDGLALSLEEHVAAARWRHVNGELALVNRQGELFVADLLPTAADLPLLSGPEGSAGELLRRHAEFSATLVPIGRRIEGMTLSSRRALQLKLDDGLTIELGRDQENHSPVERLALFVEHYERLKTRVGSMQVIDMRYPNGFALITQTGSAGRKT